MRLIDIDAMEQDVYHIGNKPIIEWKDVQKQSTIDAVPVIRCKDCTHLFDGSYRNNCCEVLMEKAKWVQEITVDDNWYCKDGERKS